MSEKRTASKIKSKTGDSNLATPAQPAGGTGLLTSLLKAAFPPPTAFPTLL